MWFQFCCIDLEFDFFFRLFIIQYVQQSLEGQLTLTAQNMLQFSSEFQFATLVLHSSSFFELMGRYYLCMYVCSKLHRLMGQKVP